MPEKVRERTHWSLRSGFQEEVMFQSLNSLFGSVVHAVDGDLGRIQDFLFDDCGWTIRYLVVETRTWFSSRLVLISPAAAGQLDWEKHELPINVTMEQVRYSPDVDASAPVSLREEIAMSQYYGWPAYWSTDPPVVPIIDAGHPPPASEGGRNLRSTREIAKYQVCAPEGELGSIDDLIIEDSNWRIRYLVTSAGIWLSGQKPLVATRSIDCVSWSNRRVALAHCLEEL
jgi:hypothetical protein